MRGRQIAIVSLVIAEAIVCVAWYFAHQTWEQAKDEHSMVRQLGVNCLIEANKRISTCQVIGERVPDDLDHCSDAVSYCKQRGLYSRVDAAEAAENTWWLPVLTFRILAPALGGILLGLLIIGDRNPKQ